ncbi:MAG: hypothetical protein QXX08_07130 [Candidatus Bathyarchaeia archaeon]
MYEKETKSDLIEEALRIAKLAEERNLTLRLIGAAAIRVHTPKYASMHIGMKRELSDLDFVGYSKQGAKITAFLEDNGYEKRALRPSYGLEMRHIYLDNKNNRQLDVFLDKLLMCHVVDFTGRLEIDYPTIPLAELLLTKLQIVNFTEKDLKDTVVLFREHEVGKSDKETINSDRIAEIMSDDWGFYYTATTNLKKIRDLLPTLEPLKKEDIENVTTKINQLLDEIEKRPKSFGWKMRAKVGTKKKWYKEVF